MNFTVNNYSNNISINDTHSIYINIMNKITFQSYESTIIKKDIPQFMDIPSFYKFMVTAYENSDEDNGILPIIYEVIEGKIAIRFRFTNTFINIDHTLFIKEMVLSSDKLLTTKINSMKEMYENKITELENKLNKLNNVLEQLDKINNEPILIIYAPYVPKVYMNKSIEKLNLTSYNNINICWLNFNKFTNISELIVNTSFIPNHDGGELNSSIWRLNGCPFYGNYLRCNQFFDLFNFPKVTSLKILYISGETRNENLGDMSNIPNLEELILENFDYKINVFDYIKVLTNLKKLVFINSSNINKIAELREYCISKKIKLEII